MPWALLVIMVMVGPILSLLVHSKEPAIINLDGTDPSTAQRILDFAAGAMYALNGSVLRISGNIFLLSPEGVGVTVPHEMDKK